MSSTASKAAYRRCPETCQKVRDLMDDAIQDVLCRHLDDAPRSLETALVDAAFDVALKFGTEKVRAALIECEEELIEVREVLETTEDDLKSANSRVDELENEVMELERRRRDLEDELDIARSLLDDSSRT